MEKTIWEKVAEALELHGIEVYPPATKQGECHKEYTVLKEDGSSQLGEYTSEIHYYTFMCYVPKEKYTQLSRYKQTVKNVIATDLYPLLIPTGQETPDFYDDTVKAHMGSITYRNSVRNIQL